MAHFYGTLSGNRGTASRLGTVSSGMNVKAASWQGAVSVMLDCVDGIDVATVSLIPWHGKGTSRTLYDGPVSGAKKARAKIGLTVPKAD